MASPRTRRVLQELKPLDDNGVSNIFIYNSMDLNVIFLHG